MNIIKFGISTSSSSNQKYPLRVLEKLCYCHDILERNKWSVPNKNQFMVFFSTWWNNNCALIVSGDSNYGINLLVYEMSSNNMSELMEKFYIDGGYSYLSSAKDKVKEVEKILKGENQILYKGDSRKINYLSYEEERFSMGFFSLFFPFFGRRNHLSPVFSEVKSTILFSGDEESEVAYSGSFASSFSGSFANYNQLYTYGQVSNSLTSSCREFLNKTPDNFIKPLDIIKTSKDKNIHTGIYLGKGKVCHNLPKGIVLGN